MIEAFIGKPIEALPTPALVVDIEALDHNLNFLADYFSKRSVKLRPHFKSNKCVTLAKRQLAAGSAVGITCAKLSEAEFLVAGGVTDVLIANQVVGPEKAERLASLNRKARVRSAVDSETNVRELGLAAGALRVNIGVLVEVDVGMRRSGVQPGSPALDLARIVRRTAGLSFDGLQAYEGHLVTTPDPAERRARITAAMEPLNDTLQQLKADALSCALVSGGGTGSFDITGNLPQFNELQAGSYALMDSSYNKVAPQFRNALSLLVTVISAKPDCVVVNAGLKTMGNEFGLPVVAEMPQAKARYIAEEHTPIDNLSANVGDKIRLIPSHGCTTCNLHPRMWITRRGVIEDVWEIEASGCLE